MHKSVVSLTAIVLAMSAMPALADDHDHGFRVGVGVGAAEMSFEQGFEATDTSLLVFSGYQFNRHLAVELMYVDGGEPDDNGIVVGTRGAYASALGILPLGNRISMFARVGVLAWEQEADGFEREGTDVGYGLGAACNVGPIQLRLEGTLSQLEDADFQFVTLQGLWRFDF